MLNSGVTGLMFGGVKVEARAEAFAVAIAVSPVGAAHKGAERLASKCSSVPLHSVGSAALSEVFRVVPCPGYAAAVRSLTGSDWRAESVHGCACANSRLGLK
jgi:hypothetical protein